MILLAVCDTRCSQKNLVKADDSHQSKYGKQSQEACLQVQLIISNQAVKFHVLNTPNPFECPRS